MHPSYSSKVEGKISPLTFIFSVYYLYYLVRLDNLHIIPLPSSSPSILYSLPNLYSPL